eukprot:scaffold17227_cov157-Isochrysis_galbana.AAC.3
MLMPSGGMRVHQMTEFLPPRSDSPDSLVILHLVLAPARVDRVESERGPAGRDVDGFDVLSKVAELIMLHVDGDVHEDILVDLAALGVVGLGAWRAETLKWTVALATSLVRGTLIPSGFMVM